VLSRGGSLVVLHRLIDARLYEHRNNPEDANQRDRGHKSRPERPAHLSMSRLEILPHPVVHMNLLSAFNYSKIIYKSQAPKNRFT